MPPTAAQNIRTSITGFDINFRYFALGDYFTKIADLSIFTADAAPTGWTISGNSITTTTPWTEITSDVAFEGRLTEDWTDGTISFTCDLRGYNYNKTYLASGYAILCLYKITNTTGPVSSDTEWILHWLGVIDANTRVDDYQHGDTWSITIRSAEAAWLTTDAIHLTLGAENVAEDGATVDASSILATPESEVANGEFVGTTVDLSPSNIVDNDMRTLWISQDPPITTGETPDSAQGGTYGSSFKIDEVFCWPVAGYNQTDVWWVEFVYIAGLGSPDLAGGNEFWIWARNAAGDDVIYAPYRVSPNAGLTVAGGDRFILCGNRAKAEAYAGPFHGAAKQIIETKGVSSYAPPANLTTPLSTERTFSLHPTDGYIIFGASNGTNYDAVVWGNPTLPALYASTSGWIGDSVIAPAADSGHSIRRYPSCGGKDESGTGTTDSNRNWDWKEEYYPRPGDKWTPNTPQWLKVTLRKHETLLTEDAAIGAEVLKISDTYGWPDTGDGIIEGETFTYEVDGATLTLDAGLSDPHANGAALYPYADSQAQWGWLTNSLILKRPIGKPNIMKGRVYISHEDGCGNPNLDDLTDAAWESDYDHNYSFNATISETDPGKAPPISEDAAIKYILQLG